MHMWDRIQSYKEAHLFITTEMVYKPCGFSTLL